MMEDFLRRLGDLERRVSILENNLSHQSSGERELPKHGLIVSRKKILEDNLAKAKQLFSFSEEGDFILACDSNKLNTRDKFVLYLIAKAYTDADRTTNKEISEKMRIAYNSTKGSVANKLRQEGVIISEDGTHRIEYSKIPRLLDEFIGKITQS